VPRPAGRRAAARVDRPGGGGRRHRGRYERLWHEVTYEQEVARRRPARHRAAHPAAQRAGLRRRRGGAVHGGRRLPGTPEGGRRRLPHPPPAAPDRAWTPRRTRPGSC
jgi:hypothetical protein